MVDCINRECILFTDWSLSRDVKIIMIYFNCSVSALYKYDFHQMHIV